MYRDNNPRRIILGHQINRANQQAQILADGPGPGGASHTYRVDLYSSPNSTDYPLTGEGPHNWTINFQDGPLKESGLNGITDEALIAIIIDRLRGFQQGQYSSRENACALTHFEEGLMWLHKRTLNREQRGVEGTSAV